MCGIFCILSPAGREDESKTYSQFEVFKKNISRRGPDFMSTEQIKMENFDVFLASSVLWLQGNDITEQPLKNERSIFIYNGDIFGGCIPEDLRTETGDSRLFWNILDNSSEIVNDLSTLQGPYAFIYLNLENQKIYFARDIYGRRSLLMGKNVGGEIIISSVAKRHSEFTFMELPSIGVFCFDFICKHFKLYPWKRKNENFAEKLEALQTFLRPYNTIDVDSTEFCENNMKFTEPTTEDLAIYKRISGTAKQNYVIFETILKNKEWLSRVLKLENLLETAVKARITTQPNFCQNCYKSSDCEHCLTGVLFSGGLDCAILALLADKLTDKKRPLDLINVSFDKIRDYKSPDRLTAEETLQELEEISPDRNFNLVQVNVDQEELNLERSRTIADLIFPLNSVLDDSLGCALWFAARGCSNNYKSPCRVLLVGMGADELFGGYTRHRAALQKTGFSGLHQTLYNDWQNLSHRNLSRDDRVVSDHGRQLRTPYLDENLVEFVRSLNSWEKTFPAKDLPQGIGEKILLRSLAYYLGLKRASGFKKRALQFGSRIADKNEKGHEISARLL